MKMQKKIKKNKRINKKNRNKIKLKLVFISEQITLEVGTNGMA